MMASEQQNLLSIPLWTEVHTLKRFGMLDYSAIPVPSGRQPPTVYNQVESRCRRLWAQKVTNDGYHPPIASRTER
jgi:hypothetical protein